MSGRVQLAGTPASGGIAVGPVHLLRAEAPAPKRRLVADPGAELERLGSALTRAQREIEEIRARTASRIGDAEAQVFDAHVLFLQDPSLLDAARARITQERVCAEWAFHTAGAEMAAALAALEDPYLRERAADLTDVVQRVVRLLMGAAEAGPPRLGRPSIIVAHDLAPSTAAHLDPSLVLGLATDAGGTTSHTAIMARSLGIPAVVGLGQASIRARSGVAAILDGDAGTLTLCPRPDEMDQARARADQSRAVQRRQRHLAAALPSRTADGEPLELAANIGSPQEAAAALDWGADGIGLFRTEFLYMGRGSLPTEDEQYQAYREVLERMAPRPVTIRTLDVGGDKQLPALPLPPEANPFLGLRAIRLCLAHPHLFKTQVRALLRASAHGRLRIMYPMIQSLGEVHAASAVLAEAQAELAAEGRPMSRVEVGIMVEVPAAALIADLLAPHVDFFSIGTNDLIQYTLAVDRTNERVAHLFQPCHPALLRLIHGVCAAAHGAGKWVGICGELAGDPIAAPVLLGLGLDEWSMSPPSLPRVREALRASRRADAEALAQELMQLADPAEVRRRAEAFYRRCVTATSP